MNMLKELKKTLFRELKENIVKMFCEAEIEIFKEIRGAGAVAQ